MSWKGFMNKLVVGKKRDKDFNRSNLPTNRRQVFKFAYKQRWLTLFNVNLLAVLFALPFILFEITYFIYSSTHAGESVTKQNSIAISCFSDFAFSFRRFSGCSIYHKKNLLGRAFFI